MYTQQKFCFRCVEKYVDEESRPEKKVSLNVTITAEIIKEKI